MRALSTAAAPGTRCERGRGAQNYRERGDLFGVPFTSGCRFLAQVGVKGAVIDAPQSPWQFACVHVEAGGSAREQNKSVLSLMPVPAQGANPYLKLLYEGLQREGIRVLPDEHYFRRRLASLRSHARERASNDPSPAPNFVHYHWPENKYGHSSTWRLADRSLWFFGRLALQKRSGAQIVWTMHNRAPHENPAPEFHRRAAARMLSMTDIVLVSFDAARDFVAREYGRTESVYVLPHGSYRGHYPDRVSRVEARKRLGLGEDEFVFLVFGDLRPYKNTEGVLRAFAQNPDLRLRLIIAGAPRHPEYGRRIQASVARDPRVLLHMTRIADDEVQTYFRASDVLVLGQETFSSGSAILGLDFDLPLLGKRVNHVAEVALGSTLIEVSDLTHAGLADGMRRAVGLDLSGARRDARRSADALARAPIAHRFAEILRSHAG